MVTLEETKGMTYCHLGNGRIRIDRLVVVLTDLTQFFCRAGLDAEIPVAKIRSRCAGRGRVSDENPGRLSNGRLGRFYKTEGGAFHGTEPTETKTDETGRETPVFGPFPGGQTGGLIPGPVSAQDFCGIKKGLTHLSVGWKIEETKERK